MTREAPPEAAGSVWRNGSVLRWITAYALSLVGDSVYFITLGWTANQVAAPAQAGLVMAVGTLPRAILMIAGGVFADRWSPRSVVITSDAIRCIVIIAMATIVATTEPSLPFLIAVALTFGAVDAIFLPAIGALAPRIAPANQQVRLQGMRALALRIGNVAGPPLGGAAIGLSGPAIAFGIAGIFFLISVLLLLGLRFTPNTPGGGVVERSESAWHDLVRGLQYVVHHRLIGVLALSVGISELAMAGPLNIGLILLSREHGWGPSGVGWIIGCFAGAAGLSSMILAMGGRLPRAGWIHIGGVILAGASIALIGLSSSLFLAMASAVIGGIGGGFAGSLAFALAQTHSESEYMGRVTAVLSISIFGLAPVSYPAVGAAIDSWGIAPTFVGCGLVAIAGAIIPLAAKDVRRAELPR